MKNLTRTCMFMFMFVMFTLFGANSAYAIPVELRFSGSSSMYEGAFHVTGSILYDTEAFVNDSYDVALATIGSYPPFYAGHSSYIQSLPSTSLFRLESADWDGFDIESFNTATDFVNTISISTVFGDWPPVSRISFQSVSDQFSLVVESLHLDVHAFAYAADISIYDIPTAATPFWPYFTDYSEYYYSFRQEDFEDAGPVNGITPVPEPGTVVMMGAGLAALALLRKRHEG